MATRQYIGARYVPKFADPIEWDNARSYEALEIVTYLNTSYTSKKPVPAGVEITNNEYWAATGNYNAQVAQYVEEVQQLAEDYEALTKKKHINRGRAKAFWNSGTACSVGVYETNMTGFRYLGRDYYTDENVYIPTENKTLNGHLVVTQSDTKVTSLNLESWQAIFGVVNDNEANEYLPCIVPVMQVLSVSDNTLTVGKTKEGTDGASLTGGIVDNIAGRDVLVITRNKLIAGDVTKVTAYSGSTITLENVTNIAEGDYILVAPADPGKYVYFCCHYIDTEEWRNREDDGVNAFVRGVRNTEFTFSEIAGAASGKDLYLQNTISPLASGVIISAAVAVSAAETGRIIMNVGADYSHRKDWGSFYKIAADPASISTVFPQMWVGFNYRRCINVSIVNTFTVSNVSSFGLYPWGWVEP